MTLIILGIVAYIIIGCMEDSHKAKQTERDDLMRGLDSDHINTLPEYPSSSSYDDDDDYDIELDEAFQNHFKGGEE